MSTKLLFRALPNLKKLKYDVKVIPVSITYERLWEASYLANEMVSGQFQDINMYQMFKKISETRASKLGKQIVKYCDPIDINEFIAGQKSQSVEALSLNLSQRLY